MDKNQFRRMLVVLAHPDDESYGAGGTLAKYAHEGVQVVLLTATRGEVGIPGTEPGKAGIIRELELLQAARHLGIEVHFLNYQDGELSRADPEIFSDGIRHWMDRVKPQVVLTFGPDGVSGHPDHVAISNIVTQVVEKFYPKTCLIYIAPSEATFLGCGVTASNENSDEPLISVDISDYKIEKISAIQSHLSQHPPLSGRAEEEVDKIPCHEYFRVAQTIKNSNDLEGCFNSGGDFLNQPF